MTSVRLSTDSKASTSSLGSLPSLPDTHSFTPAQDRLEYLTKMISSLDTEMYQLSVSSVKLKANAAAEETMENMRACTNHIEDVSSGFLLLNKEVMANAYPRVHTNVQNHGRVCLKELQLRSEMAVPKLLLMLINCA